ncbi:molybdopterin molybdotransferase MoeA [Muricauda sp. 2012CJ35-5]|uniref:Molybdopterin molybdenumtransferase n=1 Tax=Flagellimonas spongiicola TaxID=2942208 RepID=A0ABT0PPS8_9FLAO|nr:molybdopterin molybdotransferase MoeA [Allomuricauda spongiicola]MCL6273400.1 molybdopterin molybdotransferase MoeA [Allomuricauda spongiicola]
MIPYEEAIEKVLNHTLDYGTEEVTLEESNNRILDEDILADRDFPPFDRATKDGIALKYTGIKSGHQTLLIAGMAPAGSPQLELIDEQTCIEIMTGAIVPKNADTVVMYEHLKESPTSFELNMPVKKGQNIHYKASDIAAGEILLHAGTLITAAEIGIMASVGKSKIKVKKLPRVAVISTGNELVDVDETPEPHQIRKSNSITLRALLQNQQIDLGLYHLLDEPVALQKKIQGLLLEYDVLLLSGGVSKGKFDYLPETFNALGVEKIFHKVRQRPGKPFWFGRYKASNSMIFSFPGNPVSTFVSYHMYFVPWLNKTLGVHQEQYNVHLGESMENTTDLTVFIGVKVKLTNSVPTANRINTTGSGDLLALTKSDGFVRLAPGERLDEGNSVIFIPTRRII